jgi:uncharacterized membrane protein YhdT
MSHMDSWFWLGVALVAVGIAILMVYEAWCVISGRYDLTVTRHLLRFPSWLVMAAICFGVGALFTHLYMHSH